MDPESDPADPYDVPTERKSLANRLNDGCIAVGMVVLVAFLAVYGLTILTGGN